MMFRYNLINAETKRLFEKEGIYDLVVFDWWTYEDWDNIFWGRLGEINNMFHSIIKPMTGYHNWSAINDNNGNVRACAKVGMDQHYEGMISYTTYEPAFDKNYLTLADVSWNSSLWDKEDEFEERYAYQNYPDEIPEAITAFKNMIGVMRHKVTYQPEIMKYDYYGYGYRRAEEGTGEGKLVASNFPGSAYKRLISRLGEDIPMLEKVYAKSTAALNFFENAKNQSSINNTWTVTAMQYNCLSDEYLTIYRLSERYKENTADAYEFIRELDRLINNREKLMALAEDTRIHATAITYLRNMSIFRQVMLDLRDYFKREVATGNSHPAFDVTDWRGITTEATDWLR